MCKKGLVTTSKGKFFSAKVSLKRLIKRRIFEELVKLTSAYSSKEYSFSKILQINSTELELFKIIW